MLNYTIQTGNGSDVVLGGDAGDTILADASSDLSGDDVVLGDNGFADFDDFGTPYAVAVDVASEMGPRATQAGDSVRLTYDGSQSLDVYFPAIAGYGTDTFYVGDDGSTYTDARLCSAAYAAPTPTPYAPWPMFHNDSRNRGRSPYVGSHLATMKWSFRTGDDVLSSGEEGANTPNRLES